MNAADGWTLTDAEFREMQAEVMGWVGPSLDTPRLIKAAIPKKILRKRYGPPCILITKPMSLWCAICRRGPMTREMRVKHETAGHGVEFPSEALGRIHPSLTDVLEGAPDFFVHVIRSRRAA